MVASPRGHRAAGSHRTGSCALAQRPRGHLHDSFSTDNVGQIPRYELWVPIFELRVHQGKVSPIAVYVIVRL